MHQPLRPLVACAFLFAFAGCSKPAPIEQAALPALPETADEVPAEPPPPPVVLEIAVGRIAAGQTMASALDKLGLGGGQVVEVIESLQGVFDFRKSRVGDQIRLTTRDGRVETMEYRASPTDEWLVRREGEGLIGERREVEIEQRVERVCLKIESSLYESMIAAGEAAGFAVDLADVFAWDVDFYRDVRTGDRLCAVVEKQHVRGRLVGYGAILAARYEGGEVGDRRLLRYTTQAGDTGYFDPEGNSAKKSFLKSPLKYVHVTSKYGGRKHPVLGYFRQHRGVDYRAAIGTPVWSVADGVVTRLVRGDPAAGNFMFVRHMNGYETGYLHLARFGEGMRVGARVRQKQVIAYSGNTGRSTGPHLHFEMKKAGQHVNPLAQKFPRAAPLTKSELPVFQEQTAAVSRMLDSEFVASSDGQPALSAAATTQL